MNNMENGILRPRGEKIFFASGDLVTLKHELSNKPTMLVQSVDKSTMKKDDNNRNMLLGVTCIWFSTTGELQKHRFSTKDLIKV